MSEPTENPSKERSATPSTRRRPGNAGKGRKRGVANRITRDVREALKLVVEGQLPKLSNLIDRVAIRNPGRAVILTARLAEFVLPKLSAVAIADPSKRLAAPVFNFTMTAGPGMDTDDADVEVSGDPAAGAPLLTAEVHALPPPDPRPAVPLALPSPSALEGHAEVAAESAPAITRRARPPRKRRMRVSSHEELTFTTNERSEADRCERNTLRNFTGPRPPPRVEELLRWRESERDRLHLAPFSELPEEWVTVEDDGTDDAPLDEASAALPTDTMKGTDRDRT